MMKTVAEWILDAPQDPGLLLKSAFPGVRELISEDSYFSDSDQNVFQRFLEDVLDPAVAVANETVKAGLRACLSPRGAATAAAVTAAVNFVCGFLPAYPSGLAPAVAALVVLSAHELRARGRI